MRISKYFKLGKSQPELDFVDVDYNKDTRLFLDPYFLANRNDHWSIEATLTIRSFFQYIINLLKDGRIDEAKQSFRNLSEPNETCLGLSKKRPQGRGPGPTDAARIFDSLLKSKAVESGLVKYLEDCYIFVENFGKDKLSDMTTNIIKKLLIEYTQKQCELWKIPLRRSVPSGYFWNRELNSWETRHTDMLVIKEKKIIFAPKWAVSFADNYTPDRYHRHYVLNYLRNDILRLGTSSLIVRKQLKNGTVSTNVYKKDIEEKIAPLSKEYLREFTEKYPTVFKEFRTKTISSLASLDNEDLGTYDLDKIVDHLLKKIDGIKPGRQQASEYHRTIVGILELIFYPSLICPQIEKEVNEGRKRIDLTFDKSSRASFFLDLDTTHHVFSPYILVECKNYSEDPKNPELDQLTGRFTNHIGEFGLLLCRKIRDMETFLKRCSDIFKGGRGLIIPIVDDDLKFVLVELKRNKKNPIEDILRDRLREIVMI